MATATWQDKYTHTSSDFSTLVTTGSTLNTLFTSNGWSQTSDTGQVNWGSFTWAGTSTTYYQIFSLGDTLASTFPCYLKLIFTAGGAGSTNTAFSIQFGTGSNGSGTLTGQVSAVYNLSGSFGTGSATLQNCYASVGSGWFSLLYLAGIQQGGIFVFERSVNSDGSYGTSYVSIVTFASNSNYYAWYPPVSGGAPPIFQPAYFLASGTPTTFNSNSVYCPVFPLRGQVCNPMISIGFARNSEISDQITSGVTIYGTTHTMIFSSTNPGNLINSNAAIGIRYE